MKVKTKLLVMALGICSGALFLTIMGIQTTGAIYASDVSETIFLMQDETITMPLTSSPVSTVYGGNESAPLPSMSIAPSPLAYGDDNVSESAIAEGDNVFTPDGTGTVVDIATDKDGKLFYTIVTPEDNVFYLVIDLQRSDGSNVYFLNAVTESDLAALAESDGSINGESAVPTPSVEATPEPELTPEPTQVLEVENKGGGLGTIIFIILAIVVVGGVGFYIKIIKPKKQAAFDAEDDEEYLEDEDLDYGDDDEYLPEDDE